MARASINQRVQKHRDGLRKAGLRPVQLWVPDTRLPGFAEECKRESDLVSQFDQGDNTLHGFLEAAWADLPGWAA